MNFEDWVIAGFVLLVHITLVMVMWIAHAEGRAYAIKHVCQDAGYEDGVLQWGSRYCQRSENGKQVFVPLTDLIESPRR